MNESVETRPWMPIVSQKLLVRITISIPASQPFFSSTSLFSPPCCESVCLYLVQCVAVLYVCYTRCSGTALRVHSRSTLHCQEDKDFIFQSGPLSLLLNFKTKKGRRNNVSRAAKIDIDIDDPLQMVGCIWRSKKETDGEKRRAQTPSTEYAYRDFARICPSHPE